MFAQWKKEEGTAVIILNVHHGEEPGTLEPVKFLASNASRHNPLMKIDDT